LGERTLSVCDVCFRTGERGESPFAATRAFCRQLCAKPLLPKAPCYGTNDWYYSYGDSHPDVILKTTELIVSLSPGGANRPWSVIDDGWSPDDSEKGMWDRGNPRFGDMAAFARKLEAAAAQPGIWFRPLLAAQARPKPLRLTRDAAFLDPSLPEVLAIVADDTRRLRDWGYRLIKHDYSSYDLLGRWGFNMGPGLTDDKWQFADRSRTTAEIVLQFYRTMREAAGDALLIGCNTFSHLSAGLFEINRIGDDVSGRAWDRTRRMGVNTLAFRAPQHGTFYAADPDIAPITQHHPWEKGRQWLQLLAASGMPAFVSPQLEAMNAEVKRALKEAFARAAQPQPVPEPLDWLETVCPRRWRLGGRTVTFDWSAPEGPWPFRD
jgi:alpha-galactosidase